MYNPKTKISQKKGKNKILSQLNYKISHKIRYKI
jgi:hypothetical protein